MEIFVLRPLVKGKVSLFLSRDVKWCFMHHGGLLRWIQTEIRNETLIISILISITEKQFQINLRFNLYQFFISDNSSPYKVADTPFHIQVED